MTLFDVLPVGAFAALGAGVGSLLGDVVAGMAVGFVVGLLISATGTHYRFVGWLTRDRPGGSHNDQH